MASPGGVDFKAQRSGAAILLEPLQDAQITFHLRDVLLGLTNGFDARNLLGVLIGHDWLLPEHCKLAVENLRPNGHDEACHPVPVYCIANSIAANQMVALGWQN